MKAISQNAASWWNLIFFLGCFHEWKGQLYSSTPLSPLSSLSMHLAKASSESSSPSTMSSRWRTWSASSYSSRIFCSSVVDVLSVCVPISCTTVVGVAASVSLLTCGCVLGLWYGSFLLFFAAFHLSTALLTRESQASVCGTGPLMLIWRRDASKSFLIWLLILVLINFNWLAPLSGQALETGTASAASATWTDLG